MRTTLKNTNEKKGRKSAWKNLLLTLIFLAILCVILFYAAKVTERKASKQKTQSFFAEADAGKLDVLYLGSSHVINGINPAQIYEETGITSYNLGAHGSTIPETYWVLASALEQCSPKFVMIDVFGIEKDYKYVDVADEAHGYSEGSVETNIGLLHDEIDAFPLNSVKIAAIQDLISDPKTRMEFYFDFIRYHSRWSMLTREDFDDAMQVTSDPSERVAALDEGSGEDGVDLFGAQLRFKVSDHIESYDLIPQEDRMEEETVGCEYLRRCIELCESKGVTPILIQVPFSADPDYQREANKAYSIADEYGIPFVNMMYVDGLINTWSDHQSQTHLSALGSYKVSHYLAGVLQTLGLTDHRGDSAYSEWDEAASTWHEEIRDYAENPDDLNSLLSILQMPDLSSVVFFNTASTAWSIPGVILETEDLAQTDLAEQAYAENTPYILVRDGSTGETLEASGRDPLQAETSFGSVAFSSPVDNWCTLTIDGNDTIPEEIRDNLLSYDTEYETDAQVFLFDSQSGTYLGHLYFDDASLVPEQH